MVSAEVRRRAEAHLRLAEGFIRTAKVSNDATAHEIRNAFSRAYYALFHGCCAHLLSLGINAVKVEAIARDHGRLHLRMRESMGKPFERFLRDAHERRRQSDYKPEWAVPASGAVQEELSRQERSSIGFLTRPAAYWRIRERNMTVSDLEQSVRGSLRQAGLLQYVDESETQFLEFPDGWFAEIVVKDGSKLPEVESIVQKFKTDLQREQAVEFDEIIRSVWNVAKIERAGASVTVPGLEPALRFNVALQSGELRCTVSVDVTEAALGIIRERLSKTGAPEESALQEIISEFMKFELSHGGKSYWDPRRDSRLTLDAGALMYLFGQRDAYERLKQSIDEVFHPGVGKEQESIERFVRSMNYADGRRKIGRFEDALTDLPGPGGAYSSGQRSPTSNYELYGLLFENEKRVLESYYLDQVARVEKNYPQLKVQYPAAFN